MLLGVVMSKNMVLPRILHILDYEKQGVCAYIPHFASGIEDFVIIVPEVLLRGTQARKSAFWAD